MAAGSRWESLYLPLTFVVNLKLLLKIVLEDNLGGPIPSLTCQWAAECGPRNIREGRGPAIRELPGVREGPQGHERPKAAGASRVQGPAWRTGCPGWSRVSKEGGLADGLEEATRVLVLFLMTASISFLLPGPWPWLWPRPWPR